jgi:hypothetical protein
VWVGKIRNESNAMVSPITHDTEAKSKQTEGLLLVEYEQAQESAQYHDNLNWEVTSIIWGASTLLIGFIVEAICNGNPSVQLVIAATAVLGLVLTWTSCYLMWRNNKRMNDLYLVCQLIECKLSLPHSIHCEAKKRVHERRWSGLQKRLYVGVSIWFSLVWILILVLSILCAVKELSRPVQPGNVPALRLLHITQPVSVSFLSLLGT